MRVPKVLTTARTSRVALLCFSCVGSLALLELSLRLLVPAFDPSAQIAFFLESDGRVHGAPNSVGRQAKNTGDYDVEIRFNRHGLRDSKDVSTLRPEDVLVLGDSHSFGWGVEEAQRYSDLLADRIGRRVFNAAAPGHVRNYQAALSYVRSIGGRPDEVVIGICMENDLLQYPDAQFEKWPGPWPRRRGGPPPLKAWLSEHFALYIAATHVVHRIEPLQRAAVWLGMVRPSLEGVGRSLQAGAEIPSTVRLLQEVAKGVELTILIIPSRALWVGASREEESRVHERFVAALRDVGMRVVDPRASMEATGTPLSFHFDNDGHWNPSGHRLAARMLAASHGR